MYLSVGRNRIPKGNFAFVYDVTQDRKLYDSLFEAEKYLKVNCTDFGEKFRKAYEAFALYEYSTAEIKRRQLSGEPVLSREDIITRIVSVILQPSSVENYKTLIIDRCRGRESDFAQMLFNHSYLNNLNSDYGTIKRVLIRYIRSLYSFGSENSHVGIGTPTTYSECFNTISSFFDFLRVYYRQGNSGFKASLVPIDDYIPVEREISEKMGLRFDSGKYLYVKEKKDGIQFFVLSQDNKQISKGRRRDIDVIEKLWEDNFDDPTNVIRQIDHINGCEDSFNFRVYSLPGLPLRITKDIINSITIEDKIGIISGICNGLSSIHNYDPPLYHRNINPDAFYLFQIKGKYKALLAKFDCAKDTDPSAEFTVLKNVKNNLKDQTLKAFYAPEVLSDISQDTINWEKADIYSLGKLCIYILTGEIVRDADMEKVVATIPVNKSIRQMLINMISLDLDKRPAISDVVLELKLS